MRKLHILLLAVVSIFLLLIAVELKLIHTNWFSVCFGFGSILSFLYFVQFIPEAILSLQWPVVEGEIIKLEVGKSRSMSQVSLYPIVAYSYQINGTKYQSERIKVGTQSVSSTSDSWTEGTLTKYPIGKKVNVYFNPRTPTKAVLEPGLNLRITGFGIMAIIFLLLAWGFGFVFGAL